MEVKNIQEQRMKGYFVDAAKEILKSEGLKAASVRNIAERAGYSYATLYNYFKDVNDLIFVCVSDFQEECVEKVLHQTKKAAPGKEKLKAITKSYISYFVEYTSVFDLFFLEKISSAGNKKTTAELICNFLDRLCADEWNYCIEKKIMKANEVEVKRATLNYVVSGMLLFYINRATPSSYAKFQSEVERQLNFIFEI